MSAIRAVIADDEAHLRQYLRQKLNEVWPELQVAGEAGNGTEALSLIEQLQPQVAFLDIRMPGLTGLQVAEKLTGVGCRIVFVTAYDAYAVEAHALIQTNVEAIKNYSEPIAEPTNEKRHFGFRR